MAVVLDGDGAGLVGDGLDGVVAGEAVHVGIEIAGAHLVLVSQVDAELVEIESYASGEAVGGLPIGVVGGGSHHAAGRVERQVADTIGLVHGRHVVVADTHGDVLVDFILGTGLQG